MAALVLLLLISHLNIFNAQTSTSHDGSQPNSCNSCCQGQTGLPGVPGVPGSLGSNGLHGRDGVKGESGMKGEAGGAGPIGGRGPLGPVGPGGDRGEQGLQGFPGKTGPRGLEGQPGADGQKGADGQPGPMGPKGEQGQGQGQGGALQVRQSAFFAYKTSTQPGNSGDVLTFTNIVTNIGSHFDTNTHKFTCVVPGTYIFTFTLCVKNSDTVLQLVKDGNLIISGFTRDTGSSYHQFGSTAIIQLSTGNQVWMRFVRGTVYSDGARLTSFSGHLLYGE